MKSYYAWTSQADRWAACVDFGSPMSAWTQEMHDALDHCNGDRMAAQQYLRNQRLNSDQKD